MKISICIPTYEMHGLGTMFLRHSFDILLTQTMSDFNVIVSDHSKDDSIKALCTEYDQKIEIHYYRNENNVGNSSANLNNAIKKSNGELIKILFQDDFLYNEHALEKIVDHFDLTKDSWLVTACEHSKNGVDFLKPFFPKYNKDIYLGENTISSPSVLTIKNDRPLLFDENLLWLMDCDYYKRCYDTFGEPKILNTITVVNRVGDHQISNTLATKELQKREIKYILNKYDKN